MNARLPSTPALLAVLALSLAALSGQALAQAPAGAASTATPHIDKRQVNQEKRIQQGVASGQLTPKETQRLEREQAAISSAKSQARSDGLVTAQERKHITQMQDRASKDIHHQKHDRQHAASAPRK